MSHFATACKIDDVPEGGSLLCVVNDAQIAVFRIDGDIFALRNECPHAGASLAHGSVEGDIVRCRIHHWGFCVRDGRYVDQDLPHFDAKKIAVRFSGEEIEVNLDDLGA